MSAPVSSHIGSPRPHARVHSRRKTYVSTCEIMDLRIYLLRSHAIRSGRKLNVSWNRAKNRKIAMT